MGSAATVAAVRTAIPSNATVFPEPRGSGLGAAGLFAAGPQAFKSALDSATRRTQETGATHHRIGEVSAARDAQDSRSATATPADHRPTGEKSAARSTKAAGKEKASDNRRDVVGGPADGDAGASGTEDAGDGAPPVASAPSTADDTGGDDAADAAGVEADPKSTDARDGGTAATVDAGAVAQWVLSAPQPAAQVPENQAKTDGSTPAAAGRKVVAAANAESAANGQPAGAAAGSPGADGKSPAAALKSATAGAGTAAGGLANGAVVGKANGDGADTVGGAAGEGAAAADDSEATKSAGAAKPVAAHGRSEKQPGDVVGPTDPSPARAQIHASRPAAAASDGRADAARADVPATAGVESRDATGDGDKTDSSADDGDFSSALDQQLQSALAGKSSSGQSSHAAAAPAQPPQAGADARFVDNNHDRIITGITGDLLPHGGTMHIRLDPPELGALSVSISVKDGVVTAAFETSNAEATRALTHSLADLKSGLESAGVAVERLHVQQAAAAADTSSSRNDRDSRDSQPRQQQQQQGGGGGGGASNDASGRQEQQRRELMRRLWAKINGGFDPVDLVA